VDFRRKHILHFIVFLIVGLVLGSMLTLKYADHAGRSGCSIYCPGRVIESGEGAYKGKRGERSVFRDDR